MSLNLSIKDVPNAIAERLRQRAARNHRSLQGELMAIIEQAASEPLPEAAVQGPVPGVRRSWTQGSKGIEQLAEEARQRFPNGTPSSVDFIRAMRDSRDDELGAR